MIKSFKFLTILGLSLLMSVSVALAAGYNGHFGDMDKDGNDYVSWEEFKAYFPHGEKKAFDEIAAGKDFDHDAWHEFKEKHGYGHDEGHN